MAETQYQELFFEAVKSCGKYVMFSLYGSNLAIGLGCGSWPRTVHSAHTDLSKKLSIYKDVDVGHRLHGGRLYVSVE